MVAGLGRGAVAALALSGCSGGTSDTASGTEHEVRPHDGHFSAVAGTIANDCDESVPDEWWLADYTLSNVTETELYFGVSYWGLGSAETLTYSFSSSSCQVNGAWFSCREVDESYVAEAQGVWTADTRVQVMLSWEWLGSEYWPEPCVIAAQFILAEL